jgi:predicted transposase YbfD/YdcC
LFIAICAFIYGADKWTEVETFGVAKRDWFEKFLELPNGIPSHDTFGRVFARLDPEAFRGCFMHWVDSIAELTQGEVVALDGKTLRHSYDRANHKSAIRMVSAWAAENELVLGQLKTADKSNEITAVPALLELLELSGCIVTLDAMGCQKATAKTIREQDTDYAIGLKGNRGQLHDAVKLAFETARETDFRGRSYDYHDTLDADHGRTEVRRYWTIADIDWLDEDKQWSDLNMIGLVESERHIGQSVRTERRSYFQPRERRPAIRPCGQNPLEHREPCALGARRRLSRRRVSHPNRSRSGKHGDPTAFELELIAPGDHAQARNQHQTAQGWLGQQLLSRP